MPWDWHHGAIVVVREQATGVLQPMHEPGSRLEAIEALAHRIDALPGDWRIICYSTPNTILGDLKSKGRRRKAYPELYALEAIDRLDLLEPR